jgi:hypothetical protein
MKYKIKIPLAIHPNGDWNCSGWGNVLKGDDNTDEAMDIIVDTMLSGERRYYIETEIELPVVEIIKAEAKGATQNLKGG